MGQSIPEKTQLYNQLLQAIRENVEADIEKLVTYIYLEKGESLEEIATVLGVSKQRLSQRFPKLAQTKKDQKGAVHE